ncbi:MAG: hypothetical protein LKI34_07990 [Bifidobacterium tibiigranuli]|jgi:hypothetical protein|uniref:hypothetical protein n=1 Tax=Bifidobacterium TaxID=1678 RepID=UPI0025C42292|nr:MULTISPECIES: hypothetical protein [Bifidobacterium]MCI1225580.1 hypothetical protein [Bifidobacterium sp.]MCI1674138.1 hypothetical protein [Bifidobacterium tibiigranuli]MCI1714179.1 hypothetical protein [Bifidobacterium tibiigranuli]MCI1834433.1 hypothetical protein [Bifidobacterium tibiigranuli]
MAVISLTLPVDAELYNRAVLANPDDDGISVLDGATAALTQYFRDKADDIVAVLHNTEEYDAYFGKVIEEVDAEDERRSQRANLG